MKPNLFSAKYLKNDFLAGLIVFLIALPLCLGIAQASGAPLFAGVVAGIVGGIVIGSLSGSHLSVSGPAAGLTAIVLVALKEMQVFEIFLCSVMIAGVVQVILGYLKSGAIANYIPTSVLEGMLAGIGLTIILKQLPDAVGFAKNGAAVMMDAEDGVMKSENMIETAFRHVQPGAIIISVTGLILLILWQTKAFKKIQIVPAGLVVVIVGTLLNEVFLHVAPQISLDGSHLVKLPIAATAAEFFHQFSFPDFNGFKSAKVWQTGVVIAVVASIETLLCIEATDKLDPQKRYTPADRELKAQGVGNIVSNLLGGLPITSVIVRSSANVNAGAMTKRSSIIHGTLLLLCAATIPVLLNLIPKSALAAILVYTGYRLCRPAVFKHMWKGKWAQFIPFIATIAGVVMLDLLKGVGIGLCLSIFYTLRQNIRIPYYFERTTSDNGDVIRLELSQEVSFLNKASIKQTLNNLPANSRIIIDASNTAYIDFDVLELIRDFYSTRAVDNNIKLTLVGFKDTYDLPKEIIKKKDDNDADNGHKGSYENLLAQLNNEVK